ncbi:MAG TPA: hypothetical protein VED24_04985 [Candidatus Acidoferrum sp.]|nr:hypothetical protein [Candidatus Acidoferrum sp.]
MNSVSPLSLGKKIIDALGIKDGEALDLSKLRDGSVRVVLVRKTEMLGAET